MTGTAADELGRSPWEIPLAYQEAAADEPGSDRWLPELRRTAAWCAERWGVVPDGPARHGWTSMAWPVIDRGGARFVLKVSPPVRYLDAEAAALQAWSGDRQPGSSRPTMIIPAAAEPERQAILLPRLDPERSLEDHPDAEEAVGIIAEILAAITRTPPLPGAVTLLDELDQIETRISADGPVPADQLDRARSRLTELRAHLTDADQGLLHNDLHFSNVLHARPDADPAWFGIDPLPITGIGEWEPIPLLRNRWADAAATGDPDRALRRRVDQVCAVTGYDPELVRSCAQLVAVFNLYGLLPHRRDHLHAPPYLMIADW
ncbi:aminoglycoside phosphotransferase family protein [Microlunatus speluncae]|uniref:aminoglycoside phosphotransferase family protein n=1 Tax=Microlunatus speluncae TaxID=2594267 RepID=UPI001375A6F0|nr:aminoglycoside phosphotransferase family protein [Microlunatus speluncae]